MVTQTVAQPAQDDVEDFDLDVSIVEAGDAVEALVCSTDNGCGTQPYNGC